MFKHRYTITAINKTTRDECVMEVSAKNKDAIEESLGNKYIIQDIQKKPTEIEQTIDRLSVRSVTEDDILKMLQFLAQALGRGVRLRKALEFLLASEEKRSVRYVIQQILDRIKEQFTSYYDVFKDFPEYFDHSFLGIVRAGESTGTLADNILQYIEDRRKMLSQKDKIYGILIKRGALFFVVMAVATIILTFVIPQFSKLFEGSDHAPDILIILNGVAAGIKKYGFIVLLTLAGGITAFVFFVKQNYQFKKTFDRLIVRMPVVGDVLRTYYTCQYLYFTGTLLIKNVNYIKIMDILIEQTHNIPFKEVFEIMRENVVKGVALPDMLKRSEQKLKTSYRKVPRGYLLPSLTQALEMGAATGSMGQILYDAFLSYEVQLHQKINKAVKIFDGIFYTLIVLIMGTLFAAMGAAMAALYQNAGSII